MRSATLLSAATLLVVLGFTPVQAQAPGEAPGGPAIAAPETGGLGGGPDLGKSGAMKDGGAPGLTGESADRPNPGAQGKAGADPKAGGKAGAKAEGDIDADAKAESEIETGGQVKRGAKAEGDIDADAKAGAAAEGKASGKKSAKLQSEDVSKVKTYFRSHKPRAKAVSKTEVSVSIGVGIPTGIVLYDLPPDVIVVAGACPIKYFVWGDDIVLVDSCTREVVEIIVGVA